MAWLVALVQGALIGIANIIPGVSGGTFALILGIYDRLMRALSGFGAGTAKVFFRWLLSPTDAVRRRALGEELRRLDFQWLCLLGIGIAVSILACSRAMAFLLDHYLAHTLAFFIGLIIPSVTVPYRLMARRGWREAMSLAAGTGGMLLFNILARPGEGGEPALPALFVSGAVAISAMILPGISGSYVLMVLGHYRTVLGYINDLKLLPLAVFAAGCAVGLAAFVRLLDWLLSRHRSVTMAFLIGLLLGSLWVLWPFKDIPAGATVMSGKNVLPAALDLRLLQVAICLLAGLGCSLGLNRLGRTEEKPR